MNNFNKYPSYKDSEIDSMGQVPGHWTQLKINNFTQVVSQKGHQDEELLSVYRDYGVIPKNSRTDNHNKDGEDLSSYKLVKPGYLVLNKMKTWQGSLGVSNYRGIVSPAYITCKVKGEFFDNKYLHYLLRSEKYIFQYNQISYGVRVDQWDMRYDDFKNLIVFAPPLPEQTAIANFLDKKTAEIKEFIALKEKTIELLKERKMAIINQAVTKGLDPTVEMKDSGIEWLGEIPKHWEVKKLKYLSYCKNNQRIPIESSIRGQMKNPRFDYYGATGVIDKVDDFIFDEDLILIAEDGANLLMRNIQLVYIAKGKYWVNNHAHIFKPKQNMNIEFLANCMEVFDYSTLISGSAQPKLTKYAILNIPLIQPPFKEQNEIMEYVQKISTEINEVISNAEREINLIKEYQQSLISEVVTGKVDVRDLK